MKNKMLIGIFSILVIGLISVGLVLAYNDSPNDYRGMMGSYMMQGYGGNNMMGGSNGNYNGMHDDMIEVLKSGNYEDLEELRDEYNMPIMYWIDSEDELKLAKDRYLTDDGDTLNIKNMPCHANI